MADDLEQTGKADDDRTTSSRTMKWIIGVRSSAFLAHGYAKRWVERQPVRGETTSGATGAGREGRCVGTFCVEHPGKGSRAGHRWGRADRRPRILKPDL